MENQTNCGETIGLFVIRTCANPAIRNCDKCGKAICETHTFTRSKPTMTQLCLSCFTDEDTRLTKDIELYSKDRYVWRRKMIARFHEEYNYMMFMAEDYGSLFMASTAYGMYDHDDAHDDNSYFDS